MEGKNTEISQHKQDQEHLAGEEEFDQANLSPIEHFIFRSSAPVQGEELSPDMMLPLLRQARAGDSEAYKKLTTPIAILQGKERDEIVKQRAEKRRFKGVIPIIIEADGSIADEVYYELGEVDENGQVQLGKIGVDDPKHSAFNISRDIKRLAGFKIRPPYDSDFSLGIPTSSSESFEAQRQLQLKPIQQNP